MRVHGRKHLDVDPCGACRVIDGDTIMIGGQRMRLYGIDAPAVRASRGAPHCPEEDALGAAAKDRLEQLMRWGAASGDLRFEILNAADGHKRPLVKVYACGLDLGAQLVADGLAAVYDKGWPKPVFCSCASRRALYEADAAVRDEKASLTRSVRKRLFVGT